MNDDYVAECDFHNFISNIRTKHVRKQHKHRQCKQIAFFLHRCTVKNLISNGILTSVDFTYIYTRLKYTLECLTSCCYCYFTHRMRKMYVKWGWGGAATGWLWLYRMVNFVMLNYLFGCSVFFFFFFSPFAYA